MTIAMTLYAMDQGKKMRDAGMTANSSTRPSSHTVFPASQFSRGCIVSG